MPNNYNYTINNKSSYRGNTSGSVPAMFPSLWPNTDGFNRAVTLCLTRVFVRMFAALLVTALTAYTVASSPTLAQAVLGNMFVFIIVIIAELGLVIGISRGINRLSPAAANALFFLYAIVNGLTLSVIFLIYNLGVIYQAFSVCALMFGAMALYGAIAKTDLTSIGKICFMALIGIIIATLVNLFFRSTILEMIVSYVGVIVFVGLTAYDTQRIKRMLESTNASSQEIAVKKISVIGALTLYLDFINLFMMLLRLLGRRR